VSVRRSGLLSLVGFVALVVGLLIGVLAAGWKPLLGLDLQGGVAVVLKPTTAADGQQIDEAVEIIRQRVDAIGVAEPDITVQGGSVVVQLPGVDDRERALELVGSTAELRFRPVLQGIDLAALAASTGSTPTESTPTDSTAATTAVGSTGSSEPAAPATTAATTQPPAAPSTTAAGQSMAPAGQPTGTGEYALGPLHRQTTSPTTPTTAASTTSAGTAPTSTTATTASSSTTAPPTDSTAVTDTTVAAVDGAGLPPITSREGDLKDSIVVLPQYDEDGKEIARYQLGPTIVTGNALVAGDTRANLNPSNSQWFVQIKFKDGEENIGGWRRAAAACFQAADPTVCPTGRLAAVLDGVVISAPSVDDPFTSSNDAIITGNFDQGSARELAQKLRYGALPVEFERQQSQDVSATIGRDALRAGIASGLIGLAVVSIYILLYYKILGLVAIASLVLSFGLLWVIIAWLGETQGLALSLAGVVGIIVSIGVSIDSNIVYFEQIKDDAMTGRTLRSSSLRAFQGAMSTIIKADLVSLIGAALLYWLTVGPVKGFALFLGLSTLLDLVASYFFMRPAVVWLCRTDLAQRSPRSFGIPAPAADAVQVRT
jgi:preprotein translocase subunit SecD